MAKLALIRKKRKSNWKSCQSITQNLCLAYESLNSDQYDSTILDYPLDAGAFEARELAQKIFDSNFSHVVFIDHQPHPVELLKALAQKYEANESRPKLIFHLFGDFILQSPQWKLCEEALRSFEVNFVSASQKQLQLVNKLLADTNCNCVIPFPLEQNQLKFDQEARSEARDYLGLGDQFTFIYTGRLSYQKNILDIIHAFAKLKESTGSNAKLLFAGPMDDLGAPYIGKEGVAGTFFYHWEEACRSYPKLFENEDFKYLGNLERSQLHQLYQAGDAYISLSAHNDEDYGISPAEALNFGLPCILSAWGGFSSFKSYFPDQVLLCPVELGKRRHKCSAGSVFKNMLIALERDRSAAKRVDDCNKVNSRIGHLSVSGKLQECLEVGSKKCFAGFNETFVKLSSVFVTSPSAPFRGSDGGFSQFYMALYEDYAGEVD